MTVLAQIGRWSANHPRWGNRLHPLFHWRPFDVPFHTQVTFQQSNKCVMCRAVWAWLHYTGL